MTDDIWALRFEIEKAARIARPAYLVLTIRWDCGYDRDWTAKAVRRCSDADYGTCDHEPENLGTGAGISLEAAMRDLLRVVKEKNK